LPLRRYARDQRTAKSQLTFTARTRWRPPEIFAQRLAEWALGSAGGAAAPEPGRAAASATVQMRHARPRIRRPIYLPLPYFPPLMSRNGRIALIAAAVVVAVLAFVIASPGDDDEGGEQAAQTTTQAETGGEEATPAETAPEETEPVEPAQLPVTRIRIRDGAVVGGPQDITVENGDVVRIVVSADAPDDIHLHGYDIEKPAAPGQPARFRVKADIEGSFEIESHVAEDAGREPVIARLNVEPR
jgi:hypothetical protein